MSSKGKRKGSVDSGLPQLPRAEGADQRHASIATPTPRIVIEHCRDVHNNPRLRRGDSKSEQDLGRLAGVPLMEHEESTDGARDTHRLSGSPPRPRSNSGGLAALKFWKRRHKSSDKPNPPDASYSPGAPSTPKVARHSIFDSIRPRSKSDAASLKKPKARKQQSLNTDVEPAPTQAPAHVIKSSVSRSKNTDKPNNHLSPSTTDDRFRSRVQSELTWRDRKHARAAAKKLQKEREMGLLTIDTGLGGRGRRNSIGTEKDAGMTSPHRYIVYRRDGQLYNNDRLYLKEDLEREPDKVYAKFMKLHKCYDLIPTSSKLVVFDTQLSVKKAFFALVYNNVRAAPLWDASVQDFTGMLTISDFIHILAKYYKSPDHDIAELENQKISAWKEVSNPSQQKPFIYIEPEESLYGAVDTLLKWRVHRLPVVDALTGNTLCILTHKRLLRFLHLYMNDLPKPSYMLKTIKDLNVGTFDNIATATRDTPVIDALRVFVDRRVSALPVVDEHGRVTDVYAKFDVINLAAEKQYNNLDMTIEEALKSRAGTFEGVVTCREDEHLDVIMSRLAQAEVHRLVIVDSQRRVKGIVSLSDILCFLLLKHDSSDEKSVGSVGDLTVDEEEEMDEVGGSGDAPINPPDSPAADMPLLMQTMTMCERPMRNGASPLLPSNHLGPPTRHMDTDERIIGLDVDSMDVEAAVPVS